MHKNISKAVKKNLQAFPGKHPSKYFGLLIKLTAKSAGNMKLWFNFQGNPSKR